MNLSEYGQGLQILSTIVLLHTWYYDYEWHVSTAFIIGVAFLWLAELVSVTKLIPTEVAEVAAGGFTILCYGCWTLVFFRRTMPGISTGFDPRAGRDHLLAMGCSVKTEMHFGPGQDTTFQVWTARSRWCTSQEQQLARVKKALLEHRELIKDDKCLATCMYHPVTDSANWHGYMTSTVAGNLPGKEFCERGAYYGNCPRGYHLRGYGWNDPESPLEVGEVQTPFTFFMPHIG